MHNRPEPTRLRVELFLNETLRPALWAEQIPMEAAVFQPEGGARDYHEMRIAPSEASGFSYTMIEPGYAWGPVWSDAWFRLTGTVPQEWQGKTVVARIDTGTESIVWDGDNPLQGIDDSHGEIVLFEAAQGGETVTLYVQAIGMNPNVSMHGRPQEAQSRPFLFRHALLAVYDPELWGLAYDVAMAYGVMREQPADSPRSGELLAALDAAVDISASQDPGRIVAARARLAETYQKPASASAHRIGAIGHAHFGSAWLGPRERAQYQCLHTFSTAVRLMDRYPEYRFVCTQAARYEWVKNLAPRLYARIEEKIASGQWEVAGSMWAEADGMLSSGESLVRRILHGKRFFQEEFGVETKDLWLSDAFGCTPALPQILTKAGIDTLLIRLDPLPGQALPQYDFPHRTCLWQGIEGTHIFTHFLPADALNGVMTPQEVALIAADFNKQDRAARSISLYGFGGSGSGPTAEMLENARRLQDVEGMPTVALERTIDFFAKAKADAADLPIWVGELPPARHRGACTTQARGKRGNRKAEFALRAAEFLSVTHPAGLIAYPQAALDRAWKTLLLNQSHAILPGSNVNNVDNVNEVYRDSDRDYAEIARTTDDIIEGGLRALGAAIKTHGLKRAVLVVSHLSHFANELVSVPLREGESPAAAVGPDGDTVPVQILTGAGGARHALFEARNMPLHGYAVWDLAATTLAPDPPDTVTVTDTRQELAMENEALRVEFDRRTGLICRIFDKDSEREVLLDTRPFAQGKSSRRPEDLIVAHCANQFQLLEDKPLFQDVHDIDPASQETGRILTEIDTLEVRERGPTRGAIRFIRTLPGGRSRIVQTVRLCAESARIDFVTDVDWHETDTLLKVAFPVAINSARATCEIPYGYTERPTYLNTSSDPARYEFCAQKWVDLSEGNYGVALLNDCKYGYDIEGNTLRLALLRSPQAPDDPEADRGHHRFTYALLPHGGDFREGEVVEHAYALNAPLHALALTGNQEGRLPLQRSFFEVDNAAVFIETIKKAEREEAVIVRLYEGHNTRGTVLLSTALPFRKAYLCDLLESNVMELPLANGEIALPIHPFEIVTVKLAI